MHNHSNYDRIFDDDTFQSSRLERTVIIGGVCLSFGALAFAHSLVAIGKTARAGAKVLGVEKSSVYTLAKTIYTKISTPIED